MAAAGLAFHHCPAHGTPRRRFARYANPHMAGHTAQIARAASCVARRSRRHPGNRTQGSGTRSHRLCEVSPRVLSRAAHTVLARGTRARPPLPRIGLAQACSNGRRRRNRGNPPNDALHAPCGNDRCMFDAVPASCQSLDDGGGGWKNGRDSIASVMRRRSPNRRPSTKRRSVSRLQSPESHHPPSEILGPIDVLPGIGRLSSLPQRISCDSGSGTCRASPALLVVRAYPLSAGTGCGLRVRSLESTHARSPQDRVHRPIRDRSRD
jgi:hypothetical protein